MFVVKGLWAEDKKVTYLYTQANKAKDALSSAAADMVYDISAIARVESPRQKEWAKRVMAHGYLYVVCRSLQDFILTVNSYLNDERVL